MLAKIKKISEKINNWVVARLRGAVSWLEAVDASREDLIARYPEAAATLGDAIAYTGGGLVEVLLQFAKSLAVMLTFLTGSALLGVFTYYVMSAGGLPHLLAGIMVSACVNTAAPCDFYPLLGTMGLGLVVMTGLFIYVSVMMTGADMDDDLDLIETYSQDPDVVPYTERQLSVLNQIRGVRVIESLRSYAIWINEDYSTLYRWVKTFEKNGHVKIISNGKGSPLEIIALGYNGKPLPPRVAATQERYL